MQIRKIVLYSRSGAVRELPFEPGRVNIITGVSKSGKSALIEIVEYCLGRRECGVPVGAIRESVAWYAVLLQLPDSQVFIARQAPKSGAKSSSEVHLQTGSTVEVPTFQTLGTTSNSSAVEEYLSRALGISPNLHIPPQGQTRHAVEASLKHAIYYNFQHQEEIASRKFLFHRQGEPFLPQSIKDTLPYFVGAVGEDRLANVQQLRQARMDLRRLERELREIELVRGEGAAKASSLTSEAMAVGLLDIEVIPRELDGLVRLLSRVATWSPSEPDYVTPQSADALTRLQFERERLSAEYRRADHELRETRKLAGEEEGYARELVEQHSRLQPINVLDPDQDDRRNECPLCRSTIAEPVPAVSELRRSLQSIQSRLQGVGRDRPRLRERIDLLEARVAELRSALRTNQIATQDLRDQDSKFEENRSLGSRRAHVAGRVSLYLESVQPQNDGKELEQQFQTARGRVEALETAIDEENTAEILTSALNYIGRDLSRYAGELALEHSQYPLRLDLPKLTVVADSPSGPVTMEQMGSGENWVGYHIAAHLALHKWFIERKRPVPRFLILDQPSQVHYPATKDTEGALSVLEDEDQQAVRKMFELIFAAVERLSGNLQVIVTDHAEIQEEWFENAIVERWRSGRKLIPQDWL